MNISKFSHTIQTNFGGHRYFFNCILNTNKECVVGSLSNQGPGQVCSKNIKPNFIACELSVKRVVTFGVLV